jgi:hypothetical protein
MINPFDNIEKRFEQLESLIKESLSQPINTKPTEKKDEILTRQATAKMFGVSVETISDWANKGIIKMYKVGNRSYFKHSELIQVLTNSNTTD